MAKAPAADGTGPGPSETSLREWLEDGRLPDGQAAGVFELLDAWPELDRPVRLTEADHECAWRLWVDLETRITTQALGRREGDESAALASVASIFRTVRELVADQGPEARTTGSLGVFVLNQVVRPFTGGWHGRVEGPGFVSDDQRRSFRHDLEWLQIRLGRIQHVLLAIADPQGHPTPTETSDGGEQVDAPPLEPCAPGPSRWAFAEEEARAIAARRAAFSAADEASEDDPGEATVETSGDAVGLGISGGGIRSATFALGVLQALSEKDLYRHLDYISTVSGGGYLGSLISTWATGSEAIAEKRRGPLVLDEGPHPAATPESLAVRHARNHSRTFGEGARWHLIAPVGAGIVASVSMFYLLILVVVLLSVAAAGLQQPVWGWEGPTLGLLPWWGGLAYAGVMLCVLPVVQRLRSEDLATQDQVFSAAVIAGAGLSLLPWLMHGTNLVVDSALESPTLEWLDEDMLLVLMPALTGLSVAPLTRLIRVPKVNRGLLAISPTIAVVLIAARLFEIVSGRTEEAGVAHYDLGVLGTLAGLAALALLLLLIIDVNHNSPHRFYRDRLARAWCVRPDRTGTVEQVDVALPDLSEHAPVHLVNTTVNLVSARDPTLQRELRGRNADFVCFSRHGLESRSLGTWRWGDDGEHGPDTPTLPTVMAISGAALGPRLGVMSQAGAGSWLTLLNLRMGYWLRNPRHDHMARFRPAWGFYLLREALGLLHEETLRVNLSDGGHLENLGLYELLRRRCRTIIAIDGEADPQMGFDGLVKLLRYARIDLGTEIDIELSDMALDGRGFSSSHAAVGDITYDDGTTGLLLYIKLSVTGDEPGELLDYRRRSPTFPHESTVDQVFEEEQFEAYRRLGHHVGELLTSRVMLGGEADPETLEPASWVAELRKSLVAPSTTVG